MLTIIGLILAFLAVFGGQFIEGGRLSSLLQPTAALIVFGGTLGAIFIQYPFSTVRSSIGLAFTSLFSSKKDLSKSISEITGFSRHAQKDGILSLETHIDTVESPFLKKGLQLVVDGAEIKEFREILELEIHYEAERRFTSARVFESAGGYAPTLGILGAVLGLIQVMENLADPTALGQGIAIAFVATVYGVASANLIWLPIAGKIKIVSRDESVEKELYVEGLVSLASGESSTIIGERLEGFLSSSERKRKKADLKTP